MSTTLQTIIEIAIRYGRATELSPLTYSARQPRCSCDHCRIIEAELAEAIRAFACENPTKPY